LILSSISRQALRLVALTFSSPLVPVQQEDIMIPSTAHPTHQHIHQQPHSLLFVAAFMNGFMAPKMAAQVRVINDCKSIP
jgi:hypothetical protein